VIDGSLDGRKLTAMAGVANIGADRNWSGSQFDQANWYVFGRLAWDPEASTRDIAADWARMTFSNDKRFVAPVVDMMMGSRETVVDYMTPLGLHHQMGRSHHYGPGPWVSRRRARRLDQRLLRQGRELTASASTAPPRAATPWRNTRLRWGPASPTSSASTRRTCCGSTTCRGTTA
jgi:hypothetical protein